MQKINRYAIKSHHSSLPCSVAHDAMGQLQHVGRGDLSVSFEASHSNTQMVDTIHIKGPLGSLSAEMLLPKGFDRKNGRCELVILMHGFLGSKKAAPLGFLARMLVKQGYQLYFYKKESGTIEMDFFVRDSNSLIPVEVKANDSATASLNKMITSDKFADIKYGIKLANKNIGWNGKFLTMPYFLTFLLKRFLSETDIENFASTNDLKAITQAYKDLINGKTIEHNNIDWN